MTGLRLGVTGHQSRPGIDWLWTAQRIRAALLGEGEGGGGRASRAFTSLAMGSDQLFAREALALGVPVTAVIPMPDYARCFAPEDRAVYEALLTRCGLLQLEGEGAAQDSFFAAGRRVAEDCEFLVAVWDGKPAAGFGGTGDVVAWALEVGRPVLHLDPVARIERRLDPSAGFTRRSLKIDPQEGERR